MPKVLPEYKDIVRLKITEAALKVFSEKGYHDSKMDEIAKEAGLSKPTLYTYVESKEDLLRAISESSQKLTERSLSFEDRDTKEILDKNYKMMIESRGSLHLGFEITSLSSHDENIQKLTREVYKAKKEALATLLQNQQNNGMIKKEIDTKLAAQLLTAIYTDITTQLIIGCNESEVHEYWNRAVSAILGDCNEFRNDRETKGK
ncbi:MAG TPA: TetR/AcrR family transcriptional regulator [Candidatus Acidoferrales bacterium]|nr:TetR/AcrR family transcriptional regulator [Candidatus Acidoferrales bacterium]